MTETEASTSGADRLTSGFNHVAVITRDLDRAVEFWSTTLNAEFRDISDHHGRHLRRARYGSRFAPAPLRGPEDYTGPIANGPMMKRGRIDHQATAASDEHALLVIRDRLVERGASGGTIQQFGDDWPSLYAVDPDGMEFEIAGPRTARDTS